MSRSSQVWRKSRLVRWMVAIVCFAIGLAVGWLLYGCYLGGQSGVNL